MGKLTFVLGGARSGKSDYGEALAQKLSDDVVFIATAQAFDDEMRRRIKHHQAHRPAHWHTIESPTNIVQSLAEKKASVVLLDCMTVLVSNLILPLGDDLSEEAAETAVQREVNEIIQFIQKSDDHWIIISNEVGLSIVPENRLARLYRDVLGRANKQMAAVANEVIFMVAGLPLVVKSDSPDKGISISEMCQSP
ncbi:MAG: bifunctional adenosylcobinamide kinase/adenosylcobinamide-phosphate guanylyltransferase [Chloroflexi bacterium]|nr:MAG: bifunctional adenosylcobinamide kinase/adenosylcobinamide-phosphate guanylyltransferase [Chloroflexota bacterium]